jgi:hypothetical protein
MDKEAKIQYDAFLEAGELQIFFPKMTGIWKEDKERFLKSYKISKEQVNNFDVKTK